MPRFLGPLQLSDNSTHGATTSWVYTVLAQYAPATSSYVTLGANSLLPTGRVLSAGWGTSLRDNGAGTTVAVSFNPRAFVDVPWEFDEFMNGVTNTSFTTSVSGSGTAVSPVAGTMQNPGQLQLTTGATSTGRAAILTAPSALLFGNGGGADFETSIYIPTLSYSSQRYQLRIGFIDTTTGDQIDGVYFEYNDSMSSYWRICTANNSTRTKITTSIVVNAGSWITLRITVDSAANQATFYLNGISMGSISTNIPTTTGRETGIGIALIKSAGSSARTVNTDYIYYQLNNPEL